MKYAEINGIELEYPDSFLPLTNDEIKKYFSAALNRWAVRDAGHHTIISIGWTKPLNALTSILVSPKSFRENFEKQYSKTLKGFKHSGDLSFEICGTKAEGFSFCYEASDNGTPQSGELVTFRIEKQIFIAECSSGSDNKTFSSTAFETVLRSIRIKG